MEISVTATQTQTQGNCHTVAPWWRRCWYYLSINLWGNLAPATQRSISAAYARIYDQAWSRFLIRPYCWWHYPERDYLTQFRPPADKTGFGNFQDFFTREFKELPATSSPWVWPCEGILCHYGYLEEIPSSNVKGDQREVNHIFGLAKSEIPKNYYFTNVFLHNKNYHRIHAPVNGRITRIQYIPDELVILRPWIYEENPSIPAFRNERVNLDIEDEEGQTWHLSIVGGPAVGSITLSNEISLGTTVNILQELAVFHLGSTCCMAAPRRSIADQYYTNVEVGLPY